MSDNITSYGLTDAQRNIVLERLGGQVKALHFLCGYFYPEQGHTYRQENGLIYFSVTSDGTTGEGWINRLESKGFLVGSDVKRVLRSSGFEPTSNVLTNVALLKGGLFEDSPISNSNRANRSSIPELACLIRDKFTNEEIEAMGLWHIIGMREPISDIDCCRLDAWHTTPSGGWHWGGGLVLVVS